MRLLIMVPKLMKMPCPKRTPFLKLMRTCLHSPTSLVLLRKLLSSSEQAARKRGAGSRAAGSRAAASNQQETPAEKQPKKIV
jgi:hypothetical protein